MKYGIMGGLVRFAFAGTAFDYIAKEIPEIDMPSYGDDECNFHLMSQTRARKIGFVKSPDAK